MAIRNRSMICGFMLAAAVTACDDGPGPATQARAQLLADEAGIGVDELVARRPGDGEDPAGEASTHAGGGFTPVEELSAVEPEPSAAFCTPADFAECRATCALFGEYCFVCVIADDGFPVFYCHQKGIIQP